MRRARHEARTTRLEAEGFTLIEMMVVVLIIAVLIAIAIPVFSGARSRAGDRATQSDLRNGMTAEKVVYSDQQAYYVDATAVKNAEPALHWGTTLLVQVGTNSTADDTVCLSEMSKSGAWFAMGDIAAASPSAEAGTYFTQSNTDPCTSNAATIAGWATRW
jgi:type IV pilus assembly protein PilA